MDKQIYIVYITGFTASLSSYSLLSEIACLRMPPLGGGGGGVRTKIFLLVYLKHNEITNKEQYAMH